MKKFLAIVLCAVMVLALAACSGKPSGNDAKEERPFNNVPHEVSALKIGVILVGDENEGYTYAHIEGFKAAMAELGINEDQVTWKYVIPENATCYDTAAQLVDAGCNIIFSNSYGHQSYMVQAAEEFPEVVFVPATGDTANVCKLGNVINIFPHTYESRYVSGVVAGMKLKELMDAGTVTDPYIGYVGAYPYAEVVSGYTAFFLGIKSIVPEAHMDVMYTSSWFDLNKENETAKALMARGCVIIGQHADSTGAPSAVEAALKEGTVAYSVGYNVDMLSVAPTAALTSAQNNWAVLYKMVLKDFIEGNKLQHDYTAGYEADANMISELGASCAPGTAEKVAEVIAAIKAGTLHVFDINTFTVGGEKKDSYEFDFSTMNADYSAVQYEGEKINVITDGYFHESEYRSAPYFDLRIDGIKELTDTNN
ncbi:MAG: BMP family ABC transporter substrate-binding protein [Clostridia bacterium]|jgi:basic membrane protein A|nr:BMP family ABC transporter substrate-binding protein [Clostridia bacterium]